MSSTTAIQFLQKIIKEKFSEIEITKFITEEAGLNYISNGCYGIFINKTYLNDFVDINTSLEELYTRIVNNGFLILKYKEQSKVTIKNVSSILNFIWKRALPKTPFLNKYFNRFFNKKNRSLSKAEVWGRLMYCSFDVLYEEDILGDSYVLSKKVQHKSFQNKPSYYPIITLNRVGFHGELFKLFKIRTMYPYSEYLQKKVYEMNSLSEIGKFKNDFRITEYGKFVRKFWIDELPQIINIFKNDIKLVGIRAMSEHYFSLYPEGYKELYKRVRPGFLSPLYDNTSFECIVETESKYLEEYLKHPIKTDIKYFFRIIFDILRGKRSS